MSHIDVRRYIAKDIDVCQYRQVKQLKVFEECCPPLLESPLDSEDSERLAGILKVLADPARLRLLSLIAARGEACTCHMIEPLGLSQPTVSHHLKVLHEAGLLERERRGIWVYYRLVPGRLGILAKSLAPSTVWPVSDL